jgi:aldehyde:ferredoxin oxidoreductase
VATIGPAGENRVRFASVIHRLSNAVGNGGFGGVMGAKNLKAICVRGTRGVPIADPAAFTAEVERVFDLCRGGIGGIGQTQQGYPVVACSHGCPVNCFMRIVPTPQETVDAGPLRMLKCVNGSFSNGSHPAYLGTRADGVTLSVPKPPGLGKAGLDLGNLAEDMGMTAWFYDSWYRWLAGLGELGIHDLDGLPVHLDDPAWWRDLISDTAHRRGLGNDMAEGLARFYDQHEIGPRYLAEFIEDPGSRGHGWHREGRAMEPHPSPFWEHSALLYAVSTRDVTPSTHGFFFLNDLYGYRKGTEEPSEALVATMQGISERLYGTREAVLPGLEGIEQTALWHQHRAVIKDSMGVCDWVFPLVKRTFETRDDLKAALEQGVDAIWGDPGAEASLFSACTGVEMDIAAMERPAAERIVTLERCLDARLHGRNRAEDEQVIPHYQWPEKIDGTHLSESADEFRALLERYYDLRGWERATGLPTAETLRGLGLEEMLGQ